MQITSVMSVARPNIVGQRENDSLSSTIDYEGAIVISVEEINRIIIDNIVLMRFLTFDRNDGGFHSVIVNFMLYHENN